MKNKQTNGITYLVLSAVFMSFSGFLVKSVAWSAVSLVTAQGILMGITFLLILRPKKRIQWNLKKLICAVCFFLQGLFIILANKYTTAGSAIAIQNISPVFIIVLTALILHKKPTGIDILACVLMLTGVVLCFAGSFGEGALLGNLFALISAVLYAGVFFLNSLDDANPTESLMLGSFLYILLLPFLFTDKAVLASTGKDLLCVLAFSLLCGVAAWYCFTKGIKRTSALYAGFTAMLEPVLNPLWTFLIIGEKMTPLAIVGCCLIILTLAVYGFLQNRQSKTL